MDKTHATEHTVPGTKERAMSFRSFPRCCDWFFAMVPALSSPLLWCGAVEYYWHIDDDDVLLLLCLLFSYILLHYL